jgi:D-hydroxyproline dehydrogenase subunit beta
MNTQSIASELIDARKLYELEPALAPGLAGALHVPGDAVIYPPVAAAYFARRAATRGAQIRVGASVSGIDGDGVRLHDGGHIKARAIVLATGCALPELLPEAPVRPRKGHLLITTRAVPHIKHQLVELGYVKSAHGNSQESIAFNAQPRATGQILLGSTRQFDAVDRAIDSAMLKGLLESGKRYLPGLDRLQALRIWTGFRPTTPDKQPLIGRWPAHPRLWLAAGHEGAGITTSTGTAALLAAQLLGKNLPFDAAAYAPLRFSRGVANAS